MQIHNVEQGSDEWLKFRFGLPTASMFSKLITPTGKESSQFKDYAYELIADILTGGKAEKWEGNQWTERGNELEADACAHYQLLRDIEPQEVGFVTIDDPRCGCSPDRLLGDDGLLEIKCPMPKTHVKNMIFGLDDSYIPQIQGQLFITGRKWCDWISYHPDMDAVIVRVERDDAYIETLKSCIVKLNQFLDENLAKAQKP